MDRVLQTNSDDAPPTGRERRAHTRHPASALQIRRTHLRGGPQVTLVDLSASGALFEIDIPLKPGSEHGIKLVTAAASYEMPVRVVRSCVSKIKERPLYRCACVFHAPLELAKFIEGDEGDKAAPTAAPHSGGRLDLVLKSLLHQALQSAGRETSGEADVPSIADVGIDVADSVRLVESFQRVCRLQAGDPAARLIDELLTSAATALGQSVPRAEILSLVEERLRQALPWLAARFEDSPTNIQATDAECIYFRVPSDTSGTSPVLSVGLPQGFRLEEWQFRLLKASTYVAALLRAVSDAPPESADADRRRHPRVTGPFDGRWLAAIEMPVLITDLSEGGCLVSSFHLAEMGRQLTLEIHLPGEGALLVTAEVVGHRTDFGFAAKFVDTPASAVASLRRFVEERVGALPAP